MTPENKDFIKKYGSHSKEINADLESAYKRSMPNYNFNRIHTKPSEHSGRAKTKALKGTKAAKMTDNYTPKHQ